MHGKKLRLFLTVILFGLSSGPIPHTGPAPLPGVSLSPRAAYAATLDPRPTGKDTGPGDYERAAAGAAPDARPVVLLDREYYTSLMRDIGHAKKSIIVIMYVVKTTGYRYALPDRIVSLLIRKHESGVGVTVILDMDQVSTKNHGPDGVDRTNLSVAKMLKERGIKVYFGPRDRIVHAKVVIIDTRIVYIGSHNLTESALKYNHEATIRIVSPDVARRLTGYAEEIENED